MKRTMIAAAVLSLLFAASVFAADDAKPQAPNAPNFDQRKTEILKMLEDRITGLQNTMNCIQSAENNNDIGKCREKYRPEMRGPGPHGMGAPGGMGGPPIVPDGAPTGK